MLAHYFEYPAWLMLTVAVTLLIGVFVWRSQRERRLRCEQLGVSAQPVAIWRAITFALALLFFGLAASGPRWGGTTQIATAAGSDVAIVLDVSRSMNAKDAMPDRIGKARELASQVVESLARQGGHRASVIVFAAKPTLVAPLTYDLGFIRNLLSELDPASFRPAADQPKSGTRIGAGIQAAVDSLAHGRRDAGMILLFSDGDDPVHDGESQHGIEAANAAHIPVAVIGIGDDERDSSVPNRPGVKTRLQQAPLQELANRTGGRYFAAGTGSVDAIGLVHSLLADRPRGDDPELALARSPGRPLPFLAAGFVMLIVGLTGLRWRTATAGVAIAAIAAGPIDDLLRRGDKALAANRPEHALEYYTKTEGRAPDPGLVAFNQGVALAALGRHREAAERFRWSLSDAMGERRARALFNLGTCLVKHGSSREREPLQAAVAAFEEAKNILPADDPFNERIRENLAIAKLLLAQSPAEQSNGPGESSGSEPSKNGNQGKSPEGSKPDASSPAGKPAPGESPRPTDQQTPGKGTLPPIADTDEPGKLTADDLETHLKRAMERITAARKERIKAKESDKPPNYPDW